MAYLVKTRTYILSVKGLVKRSSGLFYFRRGVPERIRYAFNNKREIVISLQTYIEKDAIKLAEKLNTKFDEQFRYETMLAISTPENTHEKAVKLLAEFGLEAKPISKQDQSSGYLERLLDDISPNNPDDYHTDDRELSNSQRHGDVIGRVLDIVYDTVPLTLSEAKQLMIQRANNNKRRINEITAAFNLFSEKLNQDNIALITRAEVQNIIDKLASQFKSSTIHKRTSLVKNGLNELMYLRELDRINPFENVHLPMKGTDSTKRHTYTPAGLNAVVRLVKDKPNSSSCKLIGLLINTGCRLNEIAGRVLPRFNGHFRKAS
ncbi:MAG: hypothetical protein Q7L19_15765 [Pseudohongiella sp.]|nr:hypothetical protein [Pseudohongiella sp.]